MAELATLGLSVTSEPVVKATTALNEMAGAAQKTERAAESLGASSERSAKRIAGLTGVQEKVIASLERLEKTMDRMAAEQKELSGYAAASAASLERLATAGAKVQSTLGTAGTGAASFNKSVQAVNDNSRLASHQLLNLSRQGNDVITMFALGAPPMQIFASQAGQIYDALASGEGGLKGGLNQAKNSLKDFLSGFSRAGLVLGGVAGAAVAAGAAFLYFTDKTEASFKKLEGAAKSYKDTIAEVTRGQKELAAAADAVFSRSTTPTGAGAAARIQAELETQRRAIAAARSQAPTTAFDGSGSVLRPDLTLRDLARRASGQTSAKDIIDLAREFEKGQRSAESFRTEIDRLASDKELPGYLRDALDDLRTLADGARDAEGRIKALNDATLQLKSDRFAEFGKQLREFIPDTKSARDRINELADAQLNQARSIGQAMQVEKDRQAALGELDRKEANRRAGYELDVRAITARTVAEKAAIAAERARLELANDPELKGNSAEIERRAQEASNLSLKQSQFDLAEAMRQRVEAGQSQVEQAQMEIDLVGKSVGETARLRVEYDLMTAAKQAAKEAGTVVDPSEVEAIKAQATAIGEATDALEKLNFQRDLVFRLQQTGRSDQDQRIADQLRSSGIDFDSSEGQARAQQLRYVESVEKTSAALRDMREAGKDAFEDLFQGLSQNGKALDTFISSFGRLGSQYTSAGFDKLFGGMFGTANSTGSAAGIGAGIGSVGKSVSAASSDIIRMPLADLTDSLQKSSTSALAVAKQFDGLNERADSKVLDGFLQASGNWKGLSASDTAWCASFANASIIKAGGQGTGSNMASSFLNWGSATNTPKVGDIVVLRPQAAGASGHVGFVAGFGDGKVQVFGGNQSGGANTKNFGLNQVVGYRTGEGLGIGDMTKAVADGTINAQKQIASGAVPGIQPSAGAQAAMNAGWDGFTGVDQGMSKLGTGMQTLGAGLGIFAQGAQSQSPIMGAIGGALGGFSAGAAMGAGLGPIGAVLGGIVGAAGGIFGKSKAKKEAQKAKWEQAESAWKQNLPQFEKLEDEVSRTERGPLSTKIQELQAALKQFDQLAKAAKGDNHNDEIRRVRAKMADYIAFLSENFIGDLPTVIDDLSKGQGLDTSFTKARDAVMAQADSYRGFLKDIQDAYAIPVDQRAKILSDYEAAKSAAGTITKRVEALREDSRGNVYRTYKTETVKQADPAALAAAAAKRDTALAAFDAKYGDALERMNAQLEAARAAAIEGLLRIVSGDIPEQTDIQKAIEEARGAASGLRTALVDLGMSADDTAVAIDKALAQRMAKLGTEFSQGLLDDINEINGQGYLASVRELIKSRDKNLTDAGSLPNVDTSLVDTWFTKQAQSIVDGAELTGDAFTALIKAFPELTDKVKAFGDVVSSQTVKDGLAGFLSDRLADATSERADAESNLLSTYDTAKDRVGRFKTSIAEFLDGLKFSDNSALSPKEQMEEAARIYRETYAKAMGGDEDAQDKLIGVSQTYEKELKEYFASSSGYYEGVAEIGADLKAADVKATSQLDLMKTQVGSLIDINENTKTIAETMAEFVKAQANEKKIQKDVDGSRSFGINKERNRLIDAGVKQLGLNFTGNYGVTNSVDEFLNWRKALPAEQLAAVDRVINQYIGINRASGGLVTGPGSSTSDSVRLNASNGEYVLRAAAVDKIGVDTLDWMNRTARVPAAMPTPSVPTARPATNDNRDAEVQALRADVAALNATIAAMAQMIGGKLDEGNRRTAEIAAPLKRVASKV